MTRQEANFNIVSSILTTITKYPDWRFHQILQNLDIEIPNTDQFYDESVLTLKNISDTNSQQYVDTNSKCENFAIVGYKYSFEVIKSYLSIEGDNIDIFDKLDQKIESEDIHLNCFYCYLDNVVYIGLTYDNMLDDETKKQFEDRIRISVNDLLNNDEKTTPQFYKGVL